MELEKILAQVPDYKAFLTVDEMDAHTLALPERYPGVCSVFKAGESQKGRPIYVLKIGRGSRNAFIMGCPHPNEPIGAMMLEFLTDLLCRDEALRQELDFTWYIVKTADPDGVKLNEGWFGGPFTLYNYARHFYRPASNQQVEWTFPLDYKTLHFHTPLPETAALMQVIRDIKPSFLYSLHNSAFGGAYWYISEKHDGLIAGMPKAAERQRIPLSLGEPEMPCCKVYSNAVFEFPGTPLIYDYYEQMTGQDPAPMLNSGASSLDYATRQGPCFGLVCEMPYFLSPNVMNTAPSDINRRDAVLRSCEMIEALYQRMKPLTDALCPLLPERDPYRLALEERMATYAPNLLAQKNFALQNPDFDQPATFAQAFDNLQAMPFYHLLGVGMIAAGAEQVMAAKPAARQEMEAVLAKAEQMLREGCAALEENTAFEAVAIRRLVCVQLESGLRAAAEVARGHVAQA
ncbi:MAG: hypothetical protein MR842_11970 [Clostridiales bacterium]|nr:hypothetical protein [Clostridiales bacterium]MDO4349697.1 M14 family zinc carboxypeptidase [Eubacteriales bacterium]MDY4008831.1 M14 family zinc carboxypeptidase [Candidatus Limiplasma sp.]